MSDTIYHIHHIVPRYMGGTDDRSNLIKLTIEEHAEAHRLLYEKHGNKEDYLAWKMLLGQMDKAEYILERAKLGGQRSSNKGYIPTEEHKRKISKAKTSKPRYNFRGKNHPHYKSKAQSERANKLNNMVLTCPHCGHTGKNVGNMKRWHFDKCKKRLPLEN